MLVAFVVEDFCIKKQWPKTKALAYLAQEELSRK
jgi:hypothetical protein